MSGAGKTTLVLDSLAPAIPAAHDDVPLSGHILSLDTAGVTRADVVDATPIGTNVRSTVATYIGVLDDLRRAYASLPSAKNAGLNAGDFSYNTGSLRFPRCESTGQVVLDVQFLPDVDIPCPDCGGTRYSPAASEHQLPTTDGHRSLPDLGTTVADAATLLGERTRVARSCRH